MSKGSKRRPTDETKVRACPWVPSRDKNRKEICPKQAELALKKQLYPQLFDNVDKKQP
jgi:hypothetical protein|tara:strand:+ start:4383 stop:4556 length:174 start_codon:yes stop_codon:yes gene_type:complete